MHKHEEALLNRIRKGERKAMEELYNVYAPVLLGVARRYCNRIDDAEDMLHEALLKILKGINDFKPSFEGAFEMWMRRITANQCLSELRRKIDFSKLDVAHVDEHFLNNEEEIDYNQLPELSHHEILEMMHSLPIGYRTVLNMYVFERMTHKEIAKELNIAESTSKSQLFKARGLMKKKLEMMVSTKEVAG